MFALDTLRVASRSRIPTSNTIDFLGPFADTLKLSSNQGENVRPAKHGEPTKQRATCDTDALALRADRRQTARYKWGLKVDNRQI